ncbi:hypothetical protein PF001_g26642 [Phytophthora fragariae]|uniref:Uncharacterized protein n=1 Tax=Phytophthora fragariae TaxID=53985 RepID=A0A6A4BI75_9STRA|nr:hypothetical protein PF001_g26642 [Phytophthora fragariae]
MHPVIYQSHMFVDFVSVDTYVEHPRQHGAVRRSNIGDFDMNKMFDSTTDNDPRSHEPLIGDYASAVASEVEAGESGDADSAAEADDES